MILFNGTVSISIFDDLNDFGGSGGSGFGGGGGGNGSCQSQLASERSAW